MNTMFGKEPILLPKDCDLAKWAVIACDQYTTNRKYWEDLDTYIGDAPSTLRLTFPEIYLKESDIQPRIDTINRTMEEYTKMGLFQEIPGMILVERTVAPGKKRVGVVLSVDLEQYEYQKKDVAIRATEATIIDRLPVRMRIKEKASIELPHILLLIDDKDKSVIEPIYAKKDSLKKLYDFELNQNGGRICGYHLPDSEELQKRFLSLLAEDKQTEKYGCNAGLLFAVGDGNHSMASAKEHWNNLKKNLTEEQRKNHPARYILVEVVNLDQESMDFHPIHRVIMNCNCDDFMREIKKRLNGDGKVVFLTEQGQHVLPCPVDESMTIKTIQEFLIEYKSSHPIVLDYEHSEKQVRLLSEQKNTVGILMPTFDKSKLFNYVIHIGNLPQKAFSIGTEETKRYYIEAKRIVL